MSGHACDMDRKGWGYFYAGKIKVIICSADLQSSGEFPIATIFKKEQIKRIEKF